MRLVRVPHQHVADTDNLWLPCAERCAKRDRVPVEMYAGPILSGAAALFIVWDGEKAAAAFGVEIIADNAGIQWFGGHAPDDWLHLLLELEMHMREMGCSRSRIMMRPGFAKRLRTMGYRTKAVVLERVLE